MLNRTDFIGIGDIANHCDIDKLNIAIQESSEFDMEDIYCNFWYDILTNWNDPEWDNIINGGEYIGCNGKTRKHSGIKKAWAYFAYARYIMINGYNDTPSGFVAKTNQFSIPTPLKELETLSDKYRTMAKVVLERTKGYLCKNASIFSNFNTYDCNSGCGCGGGCESSDRNTRGFGVSSSIISRKI